MVLRWPLLIVPVAIFFVIFFGIPLAIFTSYSFFESRPFGQIGNSFGFYNFITFFTDPFYGRVTLRSLYISIQVLVITVVLAYPAAYYIVRTRSKWSSILIPLLFVSSFISVVIRSLGWVIILQSGGPLNQALMGLGLIGEPLRLLNTQAGVVIGVVQFVLPFAVLSFVSVLQTIPESYEEAARGLGSSPQRVFRRVILPLSLSGIVSVSLVIFSLTMSTFTTVIILGGGRILTLPLLIYQEIIQKVNYPFASAVALILILGVLAVNVLANNLMASVNPAARARRGES